MAARFRVRARTVDMLGRQQIAGIPTAISPRRHSEAQRPALSGARDWPERRKGPGVALRSGAGE